MQYDALIQGMPIEVRAGHLIAVQHSLAHKEEPILFYIDSSKGSALYAWYPTSDKEVSARVLDFLYVTLSQSSERENHRTLVDALIGILLQTSSIKVAKESCVTLLKVCFGTDKLGQMKRVIRPCDLRERKYGELDFYLLPQRLNCYTWLGR